MTEFLKKFQGFLVAKPLNEMCKFLDVLCSLRCYIENKFLPVAKFKMLPEFKMARRRKCFYFSPNIFKNDHFSIFLVFLFTLNKNKTFM
jgi:hypothetical protein